jgi:hypothetical protein
MLFLPLKSLLVTGKIQSFAGHIAASCKEARLFKLCQQPPSFPGGQHRKVIRGHILHVGKFPLPDAVIPVQPPKYLHDPSGGRQLL